MGDDWSVTSGNSSRIRITRAWDYASERYHLDHLIASGQRNVVRRLRNEKLLSLAELVLFVLGLGFWFHVIRLPWH
jgi:hypothetical protein